MKVNIFDTERNYELLDGENNYKENCYFYSEEIDMGARIPICNYTGVIGNFRCNNCDKFISRADTTKIIKEYVDRRRGEQR